MQLIKFHNVKYYRGGSKVPYRLRFNQNFSKIIRNSEHYNDRELIDRLSLITNGQVIPSITTSIKRYELNIQYAKNL